MKGTRSGSPNATLKRCSVDKLANDVGERPTTIIGTSRRLLKVLADADDVAPTARSVLILGESGTGKELIARRVHEKSGRTGQFIPVNCANISKDLAESEFFGHERGAFTGAAQDRAGFFEQADGGTLFLDEIGDMGLEHQAKLLRAIQDRQIRRVGGAKQRRVDARILAATHQDLEKMVEAKTFRGDLYWRLAVHELQLPPLRDRKDDIGAIARALLKRWYPDKKLAPAALALLRRQPWPGNVRQLESVIHKAASGTRGRSISETAVRRRLHRLPAAGEPASGDRDVALRQLLGRSGSLTPADLRAALGVSKTTGHRLLNDLVSRGVVSPAGAGRGSRYLVVGRGGATALSTRAQLAVDLAKKRGLISRRDFEAAAGVSSRTAKRELADLAERGALAKVGTGKDAAYRSVAA